MRLFWSLLLLIALGYSVAAQAEFQYEIYFYDRLGLPVSDVQVEISGMGKSEFSDSTGLVRYFLPPGLYSLKAYHLMHITHMWTLRLDKDKVEQIFLKDKDLIFNEVEVIGTWLRDQDPMTRFTMSREQIQANNLIQDMPMVLQWTPSVVATSDAGIGVGYTGMSIRGSDPTRVNISINGVPINDSESQAVFWVNMPDLVSSVDQIQIQRGVGASTNGSVAFGATVNMNTQSMEKDFYAGLTTAVGSFNTYRLNARLGTGLIDGKYIIEGRISRIQSDGYVDRAWSDLSSWFFKGAYIGKRSALKIISFGGQEKTYQAWNGLPIQYLFEPGLRTFNTAGQKGDGTFYDNEIDHYQQTHVHLIHQYDFGGGWTTNTTFHYTRGAGYFEQFRNNDRLSRYGILPFQVGETTVQRTDLIRRRWLDNHFFGVIQHLDYQPTASRWRTTIGYSLNQYEGDHFGRIIWMRLAGPNEYNQQYYFNDATKIDVATFLKVNYLLGEKWYLYFDMQHRFVHYRYAGNNNAGISFDDQVNLIFHNPKSGILYQISNGEEAYFSIAVGSREPNRADFTNNPWYSKPRPEYLYNSELGYRKSGKNYQLGINHYFMYYIDQLTLTGRINDVGAFTRVNVDRSYRTGIELDGQYSMDRWYFGGAWTFSANKIIAFDQYIDDWDRGDQMVITHQNTDLAFSPNIIGNFHIGYRWPYLKIGKAKTSPDFSFWWKYVGSQFLDNTSSPLTRLDPYQFMDFRFDMPFWINKTQSLRVKFWINNLLNAQYVNNGWVYRFISRGYDPLPDNPYVKREGEGYYQERGVFPQAGRHWQLGLEWSF